MQNINSTTALVAINTLLTGEANPTPAYMEEMQLGLPYEQLLALVALLPAGEYVMACSEYMPAVLEDEELDVDQWAGTKITARVVLLDYGWGNTLEVAATSAGAGVVFGWGGCPLSSALAVYILPAALMAE